MPGIGVAVSRPSPKEAAIWACACAARSPPARQVRWYWSAGTSLPSRLVTSPPPFVCSVATTSCLARLRMAGSGSSGRVAHRACRRSSNGCDGRALMRSPTRSPDCRDGSRSALSSGSKTSTAAKPIVASHRAAGFRKRKIFNAKVAKDTRSTQRITEQLRPLRFLCVLCVKPFLLFGLQVLLQPRHQFDEIAGAEAVVELVNEDAFPGVAAGARRARQRKEISAAGDPCRRPALDCRGPNLVVAQPAEQLAKSGDLLLIDAV